MKKIIFLISILVSVLFISCSKSTPAPENNNPGTEFKFLSLVSQDTVLPVNGVTNITANATGSGLSYNWTASYGTFLGSGSTVKWTVCHSDKFTITCEIKDDKGHSDSKTISIDVH